MVMTGERGKGNFFEIIILEGGEVWNIFFWKVGGGGMNAGAAPQIWSGMVNFSLSH